MSSSPSLERAFGSSCIQSTRPGCLELGTQMLHRLAYGFWAEGMYPWGSPCSDQCSQCTFAICHWPFDHDDVGEPGGISNFSYEVGFEKLVHYFLDRFVSFFYHVPLLL